MYCSLCKPLDKIVAIKVLEFECTNIDLVTTEASMYWFVLIWFSFFYECYACNFLGWLWFIVVGFVRFFYSVYVCVLGLSINSYQADASSRFFFFIRRTLKLSVPKPVALILHIGDACKMSVEKSGTYMSFFSSKTMWVLFDLDYSVDCCCGISILLYK